MDFWGMVLGLVPVLVVMGAGLWLIAVLEGAEARAAWRDRKRGRGTRPVG